MRIGVTSDLHGVLPAVEECDIFLICGDIMPLNIQLNMPKSRLWLQNTFIPWANGLPCKHVVFIAGNHDFWFERNGGLEPDTPIVKIQTSLLKEIVLTKKSIVSLII